MPKIKQIHNRKTGYISRWMNYISIQDYAELKKIYESLPDNFSGEAESKNSSDCHVMIRSDNKIYRNGKLTKEEK